MPNTNLYLDEELNEEVEKKQNEWRIGKNDAIIRLIKKGIDSE